jgi:DNA repair photolyase
VKSRETNNPSNRFHTTSTEYDAGEAAPPSAITLIEDKSRSILSENDSPDLGFRFSANPYRGCAHACSYCLDGATPILMADGRTRPLGELRIGDTVLGTRIRGNNRVLTPTVVRNHWATFKLAYRITLYDGTKLVASGDHRFLTSRGWKHVMPSERPGQRPYLTGAHSNRLVGVGTLAAPPTETASYKLGYLCGLLRGDATLKRYDYSGRRRGADVLYQFRLALADAEPLARARAYLDEIGVPTRSFEFAPARPKYRAMQAIRASSQAAFERITHAIAYPEAPGDDWSKGFLAGIFDAEGSRSDHVLRIANMDLRMIEQTMAGLRRFAFDAVVEQLPRPSGTMMNVRLRGGLREHLRFFHTTGPAISRKWNLDGVALKTRADLRVQSIEPLGRRRLFDITTDTHDFIANGVVSHNCYARPTHEYLDLGAGTDFDTKIVVKREAPELLRAAFDKPSWKGDLVMFSGVTDCYQPIEAELELTRRCLEVCLEYRNPVAVISKSALVERDVELFLALAKEARFQMTVSLAFTDNELSRQIEPWAASPDRRFKVIETMAKAGVPVGLMCAPMIPGVNDNQLVKLLERAAECGAQTAGWTLLRLPGAVKQVFEDRMRVVMPLAADKVLHRIRETRGGEQLYDARFHTRGRGEGPYAEMIANLFDTTVARVGLNLRDYMPDAPSTFRRPPKPTRQLSLF